MIKEDRGSKIEDRSGLYWLPVAEIALHVNQGKVTAAELVEKSIKLLAEKQEYNAIISTLEERARLRAKTIDDMVAAGKNAGKLAGVPFIAKDNFLVFGADATAGSNILRGFNPPYQATAIERLESEGAICVAKANLDAFGHGGSTENSDFGTALNPHDTSRVPGGSSGGSAVSVVLGIVPFALGTDTGGSSRQPSSFSGCVGYKPTYGLISRNGVVAMASSTDTIGVLARSADDVGSVVDVIAGKDARDSTTIDRQDTYSLSPSKSKKPRLGLIKEFMDGIDDDVRAGILHAAEILKNSGYEVVDVSVPSINLALASYYILVPAEISSNLSRYDGQRYGFSASDTKSLDESYKKSRSLGFGREAKRRIIIGTYVLSSGYYDAYYKKAAKLRTKLIAEFNAAFETVDMMIGPVAPTTAFKIGENSSDPLKMYLADVMTVAFSLVGVPAISVPIKVSGMPVGLQITAPQRKDRELLEMAHNYMEIDT